MNASQILQLIVVSMLLSMMITTGLKTTFAEIRTALSNKTILIKSIVVNYLLVPFVTVALLLLFDANPLVEVGFIILAVCPGAPFSSVAANAAKADVPLAAGLMVLLSASSVIIAPLLLYVVLHELPGVGNLRINYTSIIRGLLLFQLAPLFSTLLFHRWKPGLAGRMVRPFEIITNVLVLLMMGFGIYSQYNRIRELSLAAIGAMLLLFMISLAMGWFAGGKSTASKKSTALLAAIRNTGIGMIIAMDNFSGTVTVMVVIIWGLIMSVLGLFTIVPFKRIGRSPL